MEINIEVKTYLYHSLVRWIQGNIFVQFSQQNEHQYNIAAETLSFMKQNKKTNIYL